MPHDAAQAGAKHGRGTYRWPTGGTYSGDWLDGRMHGVGRFDAPDGSNYEGSWVDDVKQGLGRKNYANGDYYEVCVRVYVRVRVWRE